MSVGTLAPPLSETQKAAITREVLHAVKPMFTAAEKMDLDFVHKFCLDTPDFQISWFNGNTTAFVESDRSWKEMSSRFTSQRFEILAVKVLILTEDTVLYSWQGWDELNKKDGSVIRFDPFSETTLLRKVGKHWKIASRADSGLPFTPNP